MSPEASAELDRYLRYRGHAACSAATTSTASPWASCPTSCWRRSSTAREAHGTHDPEAVAAALASACARGRPGRVRRPAHRGPLRHEPPRRQRSDHGRVAAGLLRRAMLEIGRPPGRPADASHDGRPRLRARARRGDAAAARAAGDADGRRAGRPRRRRARPQPLDAAATLGPARARAAARRPCRRPPPSCCVPCGPCSTCSPRQDRAERPGRHRRRHQVATRAGCAGAPTRRRPSPRSSPVMCWWCPSPRPPTTRCCRWPAAIVTAEGGPLVPRRRAGPRAGHPRGGRGQRCHGSSCATAWRWRSTRSPASCVATVVERSPSS